MRFLMGGEPLEGPCRIADSTVYIEIGENLASMDVMLDSIKFPQQNMIVYVNPPHSRDYAAPNFAALLQ
jgi:hypothetical protein